MALNNHTLYLSSYHMEKYNQVITKAFLNDVSKPFLHISQPLCRELLVDLFWLIYSDTLEILPMEKVSLSGRLNYLIIDSMIKKPEFQRMRLIYRGQPERAYLAAIEIASNIVRSLPANISSVAEKLMNTSYAQEELRLKKDFLCRGLLSKNKPTVMLLILNKELFKLEQKLRLINKKVRLLQAELMRLWYSGTASEFNQRLEGQMKLREGSFSVEESRKQIKGIRTQTKLNIKEYLKRVSKFSGNNKLKSIANKALSLSEVSRGLKDFDLRIKVKGIRTGDSLEDLLPDQWSDFISVMRKKLFFSKLLEEQLWILEYDFIPSFKGSLIICLDCSGSMKGNREEHAKSLAIWFMERSRQEKRNFSVILFGDKDCIEILDCLKGEYDEMDLYKIVHVFFASKTTDFNRPLAEALNIAEKEKQNQTDILFVTDGMGGISSSVIDKVCTAEKRGKIFTWAILVGEDNDGLKQIKPFSKRIFLNRQL